MPSPTPEFEPVQVGHSGVDDNIDSVDVYVFDHAANGRSIAWQWPRVRTELLDADDDALLALDRAALEVMQAVLRGDSIDEDVMVAVERESERQLRECERQDVRASLDGRLVPGRRIVWPASSSRADHWITAVHTGDPRLAVAVVGPAGWTPDLARHDVGTRDGPRG
jgi:hypothetical protein